MAKSAFNQSPGLTNLSGTVTQVYTLFNNDEINLVGGEYFTWSDTGLQFDVTPSQDNSLIFIDAVFFVTSLCGPSSGTSFYRFTREGTAISVGASGTKINFGSKPRAAVRSSNTDYGDTQEGISIPIQAVDAPGTTSKITYSLQFSLTGSNSPLLKLNVGRQFTGPSVITAYEVTP